MILNAPAIVLSRRDWREYDRLAVLLTENLGRLTVRFIGANRPAAKLKGLSEPLVRAEYRVFLSPRGEMAKAVGGQFQCGFPSIRQDLPRTAQAMACLELASMLTVEAMPNPDKYQLLSAALDELEAGASNPWLVLAFGLRYLALAGLKPLHGPGAGSEKSLWEALHEADLRELSAIPLDADLSARFQDVLRSSVEAQADRPLKAWPFMGRFSQSVLEPALA